MKNIFNPLAYLRFMSRQLLLWRARWEANWKGVLWFPPGHFYSPLLDMESLEEFSVYEEVDGKADWAHVSLDQASMQLYYEALFRIEIPPFPKQQHPDFRYYSGNEMFYEPDAMVLASIIVKEESSQVIEVGSGFSSAVMLDMASKKGLDFSLTCIEPYPERLEALLRMEDQARVTILTERVQEVSDSLFQKLEAGDVLFIDSSHTAKVGSDVSYLLCRVLPKLKPGVIVHFHDIFYPQAYPHSWIKEGRAWNETLFLRAFLIGNTKFEVLAFNAFAAHEFPEFFKDVASNFLNAPGGSIWLRKK